MDKHGGKAAPTVRKIKVGISAEQVRAAMEAYYAAFRFGKQDGIYYSEEERLEAMRSAIEAALSLSHAAGQEVVAGEFSDWFATWASHKGLTMHKTADGRYLCPNTSLAEDAHSAGCMTAAIYYMELCRQDELNSPAVARSEGEG